MISARPNKLNYPQGESMLLDLTWTQLYLVQHDLAKCEPNSNRLKVGLTQLDPSGAKMTQSKVPRLNST